MLVIAKYAWLNTKVSFARMAKKTPRLTHFGEIRISNKQETEYSDFS